MSLSEAAKKYGYRTVTLRDYAQRKRLEAVKIGWIWYTTEGAMRRYLRSRDRGKIPKRYRRRNSEKP